MFYYGFVFESTDDEMRITGLPAGKYNLAEVSAPGDYVATDEIKEIDLTQQIQFDENGTRIINATELTNNRNVELTIQKKATFPGV